MNLTLLSLLVLLLLLHVVTALSDDQTSGVKNQIVDARQYMKKVASVRFFFFFFSSHMFLRSYLHQFFFF